MTTQAATQEEEWKLDDQPLEGAEQQAKPDAQDNEVVADEPSPYDELAKEMGWKPLSDWKGPKEGWTPADQYIRTTYAKQREGADRLKDTRRQLQNANRERDDYAMRLEKLDRSVNNLMSDQEQRLRAEVKHSFETAKREAIKADDDATYRKLLDQEEKAQVQLDQRFKKDAEPDVQQMAQQMLSDPVVGRFWKEHPWVAEDEDAYSYAYAIAQDYADAGRPKTEQIAAVEKALRKSYPDRFNGQASALDDADEPREERVRDARTGQFVPKNEEHIHRADQPRRQPPNYQQARNAPRASTPEQKAAASLTPELRRAYEEQKAAGRFKGDIVRFAKICNGEPVNVLE